MRQDEKAVGSVAAQPAAQQAELQVEDFLGDLLDHKRSPKQPLSIEDLDALLSPSRGEGEGDEPE